MYTSEQYNGRFDGLATVNVASFIVWHVGEWGSFPIVSDVAAAITFLTLILSVELMARIRLEYGLEGKGRLYRRGVSLSVYSLCFIAMRYFLGDPSGCLADVFLLALAALLVVRQLLQVAWAVRTGDVGEIKAASAWAVLVFLLVAFFMYLLYGLV